MKQRLYIDTSVFGGYFDEEFSEFTRPLFERLQDGEFKLLFSSITQDEMHIALATINRADYLISWNFKHIVNVQRIRGYNSINIKNGYKELEIRSPRDFMNYEDYN